MTEDEKCCGSRQHQVLWEHWGPVQSWVREALLEESVSRLKLKDGRGIRGRRDSVGEKNVGPVWCS